MAWQQLAGCTDATLAGNADETLLRAVRAIQVQEYAAALRLLGECLAREPGSHIALDLAAFCALHTGDYGLALGSAVQCTTLKPTWARGWARLGAAQLCLGHHHAALSAYQKGLTLDEGNAELRLGLQLAQQAGAGRAPDRRAAMHDE